MTLRGALLTEADADRAAALRTMKRLATGLFFVATAIFVLAFALEPSMPGWAYVRAAAEGAMVGALADWFAVTALFRHPLRLKIPHTAIIPRRKNEIGRTLGTFVETEFLSDAVVRQKLESIGIARGLGDWLRRPENAERVSREAATALGGVLSLLDDSDVQALVEKLARRHLLEPEWAPTLGRLGERMLVAGQQTPLIDAGLDTLERWLEAHPEAFGESVSNRLPRWVPRMVDKLVGDRAYREALRFVAAVRADPEHPLRLAADRYLDGLFTDLQNDEATIERVEKLKSDVSASPRVHEFAVEAWAAVSETLDASLTDPDSDLRRGIVRALGDIGERLRSDATLAAKIDAWATDAACYLVANHRSDIASVITDTIEKWDPQETSEKLELQVGRDLQFIRINGTVVGALAGLAIFAVASGLRAVLG
ncbi:DUF445 domain-containing protein [Agromyces atrinae]|uniref:DUF445 domain-containing protein n=1 Tax=Agromyces atrinae TaxID=592376 RepID=UPI001F57B679|nr:DUF445 domain-containing protein [Agromyces atrinae]MCI2957937.1 DUF445 domain-containing protein [Agromyces atrinae]